ncbi:glycosyltransferase [Streptomyces sp. NPDC060194]|uniref:glycosyltransferase n=1 Tax=Streptomyces sp. NPDC060194 TaxID=3347069 RepID=UPI00364EC260
MRIVRVANFVAPRSGGLRTALRELGAGYRAHGHEPVLVVPGARFARWSDAQGEVITLPGPVVPGSGGYRVLVDRPRLTRLLDALEPDRIEVSDRTTLRWTGVWARRARVPSVMVSHEAAGGVLGSWGVPPGPARHVADRLNRRTSLVYSRIVCTTEWSEREFVRCGARNVVRAPLGVDPEVFHPRSRDSRAVLRGAGVRLVLCSRLSVEKRPGIALEALAALLARGTRAELFVVGEGPLRRRLAERAAGLPVTFLGHVADREHLARILATADVGLAPGPAETFGLAALETLACGTPVVVSASSASPEVVGDAGAVAPDTGEGFAEAVLSLLDRPAPARRGAARARAELFGWQASVEAFLAAHDLPVPRESRTAA